MEVLKSKGWLTVFTLVLAGVVADKVVQCPIASFVQIVKIIVISVNWTLLFLGLWLLFGRAAHWLAAPLCLYLVLSDAVQWYMQLVHHDRLYGSWVGLVLSSSAEEVASYWRSYVGWSGLLIVLAVVLMALAVAWLAWRARVSRERPGWRRLVALALVFAAVAVFALKGENSAPQPIPVYRSLLCIDTFCGTVEQMDGFWRLHQLQKASLEDCGELAIDARGVRPLVGVVVIGESAARGRLGIYGYSRDTTPSFSRAGGEIILYSNLVASAGMTAEALKLLLSEATVEDPWAMKRTLSQVLVRAGYVCKLYSAWEQWGEYDGIESVLMSGCEERVFLDATQCADGLGYDDRLIAPFKAALEGLDEKPTIIFLHLKGSHFPQANNYPETFHLFPREGWVREQNGNPQLNVGNYDNTIAFTDQVLGEVLALLKARPHPSWMVYLSDHGESVDSNCFRNPQDRNLWEIPLCLWFSPEYRRLYPGTVRAVEAHRDVALQSDQLFCGLLSLAQVTGYADDAPERNFLSPGFRPKPQRKVGEVIYEQLEGARK